jgi:hypothetical protein
MKRRLCSIIGAFLSVRFLSAQARVDSKLGRNEPVDVEYCWRPEPESNRRARICSPLRHHSAIGPLNNNLPEKQRHYVVKAGV